jgi:uncharacterized membrane protein YkvA (DUF1232 family)
MQSYILCYQSILERRIKFLVSYWSGKFKDAIPWKLVKHLSFSAWKRIAIYLALDYIILPADLLHKLLPNSVFTDTLSSAFTVILSIAIYIVPELKAVGKNNIQG